MYVYMYFYIFVSIYSFILFILFIYNKYINIYIYAAHVDLKVEDIRLVGSPLPCKSWMAPFGWDR